MFVIFRLQLKLEPYKNNDNNSIELWATIAGALTLYSSLLFIDDEESLSGVNTIVLVLILVINITFILKWIYLSLRTKNIKNSTFRKFMNMYATFVCYKNKVSIDLEKVDKTKQAEKVVNLDEVAINGIITILNYNLTYFNLEIQKESKKRKKHKVSCLIINFIISNIEANKSEEKNSKKCQKS